jgi:hypothetical protein
MGTAHYFVSEDIATFRKYLEAHHYSCEEVNGWKVCSKALSEAVVKHYSFWAKAADGPTTKVRVTYELINEGKSLLRLADQLKKLNWQYLRALPGWKTKRPASESTREKRSKAVQDFLKEHQELVSCFRYPPDERLTEGNHSFNGEVASTPRELAICFQFIKGLLAAHSPYGIVRGRREIDKPSLQRNGWIRRSAESYQRRGWMAVDIARKIQKELRAGTWNERLRVQYNLAGGTICKIAGMKISHRSLSWQLS